MSNIKEAYSEINMILTLLEDGLINKIPDNIKNFFETEKDEEYRPYIDVNTLLYEQQLKRETIILLTVLHLRYWCENEKEKQELMTQLSKNDIEMKKVLNKKCDFNEILEQNKVSQKEMSWDEKYQKLIETREEQPSKDGARGNTSIAQIINGYFNKGLGINTDSINTRIKTPYRLFKAPLKEITGSAMITWGDNLDEIYVDENFWKPENMQTIGLQLIHEVLHAISHNRYKKFSKPYAQTEYTGINEATTQIFADDINETVLSEDKDYLYFVKGIMRVMGNIVGKDKLALQYLNIDNSFEQSFNKLTDNQFETFAAKINEVYKLSKNQRYDRNNFSQTNEMQLEELKKQLLDFTLEYLQQITKENPDFIGTLIIDFKDDDFLEKYGLLKDPSRDMSANMMQAGQPISKKTINQVISKNNITKTEVLKTADTMLRQQRYKELKHKKTLGTLTPEEEKELKKLQTSFKQQQMRIMKRSK